MKDDDQNPLCEWCQGDYALDVAPFIALIPLDEENGYVIGETFEHIRGVVIISQTCDIVRESGERYHVAGCALVERPEEEASLIQNGRRPHLVPVELAPPNTYADLSKPVAIDKTLLALWKREVGFSTDEKRHKFGFAISRKFGNFAFPDEFDMAVGHLKKQAWKRHETDTELGRIYRSIREIRFCCAGGWDAAPKNTLTLRPQTGIGS